MVISNAVGTMRKRTACRRKVMPLKNSRGHSSFPMIVPGPDVLCTTVDGASQATGLPSQVESKVKVQ